MEIEIPHPHDAEFVRQQLRKLPRDKRKATFENYEKAYQDYHAADPHTAGAKLIHACATYARAKPLFCALDRRAQS